MNKLASQDIRERIILLCDFFENIIKDKDMIFLNGNKDSSLKEIQSIRSIILDENTFTIAFVGEYSSGKTSIINLLAGKSMPVSTTVSTQEATEFDWNNITIVDTPGLGSGLDEHDEITKEWLAKADLLIYVLTPDLFNSKSGERFVKMLNEYKRDNELMIVMNMIDQEGNDIDVYTEELQSVLEPKPLGMYFPTFISALYKEKSMDETLDEDEKEYFISKSRFDTFLSTLNMFVMNRREKASITTPLTRLQTLARNIAFKNKYDKEIALLDVKIGLYETSMKDIKIAFDDFSGELKDTASGISGDIFFALDTPPKDFKTFIEEQFKIFCNKSSDAVQTLSDRIGVVVEDLQAESFKMDNSELSKTVNKRIESSEALKSIFGKVQKSELRTKAGNSYVSVIKEQYQQVEKISGNKKLGEVGEVINSRNLFEATSKLASKIDKDVVLKVGHWLGHKFKPWEAVKLTSKFTKAVPLLNAASAVFEVAMAFRKKKKQEDAEKQRREFKEEIRKMLDNAVSETLKTVSKDLIAPITTNIDSAHILLKDKKIQLLEYVDENQAMSKQLEEKRSECLSIYDDIYDTSTTEYSDFAEG